jgi:hypothetical protein
MASNLLAADMDSYAGMQWLGLQAQLRITM